MSIEIAKTILHQLGGKAFIFMTGAKDLCAHSDGLSFRIPGNLCHHRINNCLITLKPDDTYTMTLNRVWGSDLKEIERYEGLYFDQLTEFFRDGTGLETTIPRIMNLGS